MRKTRLTIVYVLAVAAISVFAMSMPALTAVDEGDSAPNFQLKSVDGKSVVKLSDYTDKPTMLVFWVSWCPHCQRELPVVQKVYNDLKSKGMNVVGVSVDESLGDAREFVKDYKLTFPNAYAGTEDGEAVLTRYGVEGVPTIFIIGKGGKVAANLVGEVSEETLKAEFAKLGVK